MLKKAGLYLLLILIFAVMMVFTWMNTGDVAIDLAFATITQPVSIVLTVTLAIGWLLGVLSMGVFTLRLVNERRVLRRSLNISQSEVTSLRNLPLADAD